MTMRLILPLIALCLSTSCDGASDGYVYEGEQFERDTVDVHVIIYQSRHELTDAARDAGIPVAAGDELAAFSAPRGSRCDMHIIDPAVSYQPQWIGHEFVHCIRGDWHPREGAAK